MDAISTNTLGRMRETRRRMQNFDSHGLSEQEIAKARSTNGLLNEFVLEVLLLHSFQRFDGYLLSFTNLGVIITI